MAVTDKQPSVEISGGETQGIIGAKHVTVGTIIFNYVPPTPPPEADASAQYTDIPNPYRGLFHFGPNDASVFFGREDFTKALTQAVENRNFVTVLGASGSGKSSAVFAGLVPNLVQAGHWKFTYFRPGSDPFHALAAALVPLYAPNADHTDQLIQARKLTRAFQLGELPLNDIVDTIQHEYPHDRVLLIADQFEELYTLCPDQQTRHHFLDVLFAVVQPPAPCLNLVLTMRADFMGHALSYRTFNDLLQGASENLGPMNRDEMRRAIEMPAKNLGVNFEVGLVARILDDVSQEPGNLPLLQFALDLLWKKRNSNQLTHEVYKSIGGVTGALANHADKVWEGLSQTEQEQTQRIFIQLVHPGEGTQDTRRLATQSELGGSNWQTVKSLADARLVVTSRATDDQQTVEVVHEALIRNWTKLQQWINDSRAFRVWQDRLRVSLSQWQTANRDKEALLRGAALAEAEKWLAARHDDLSQDERTFINASIAFRRQRRRQRLLVLAGSFAFVIVVAVVMTVLAADRQRALGDVLNAKSTVLARQLSAQAQNNLPDVDLALLLSLEANRSADLLEVKGSLLSALEKSPRLETYLHGHTDGVWDVTFSPDGKLLASASADDSIRLWDPITRTPKGQPFTGHTGDVRSISFSPDGKKLVSGSTDGTVILWNVETGQVINKPLTQHHSPVYSVAFSPKGDIIASGDGEGRIILWDAATQLPRGAPLTGHTEIVRSLAFSPDGTTLASGGADGKIMFWSVETGLPDGQPLEGHTRDIGNDDVWHIAFSPDGTKLASGGGDDRIVLWDVKRRQAIGHPLTGHTAPVWSLAFSPDGQLLASGAADDRVILWNVATGEVVDSQLIGHTGPVNGVAFSPDGKTLASASGDQTIILWNSDSVAPLGKRNYGYLAPIRSLRFSPNEQFFVTGGDDGAMIIWDTSSGQRVLPPLVGHVQGILSVAVSPIQDTSNPLKDLKIVSAGEDGILQLWSWAGDQFLSRRLGDRPVALGRVSFSPDGAILATGGCEINRSPVATCASGQIWLWNMNTFEPTRLDVANTKYVWSVTFSPNGQMLASWGDNGQILLWDVKQRRTIGEPLTEHIGCWDLAFSPDSQTLISCGQDSQIILWDVEHHRKKEEIFVDKNSTTKISSLAYSPDSNTLAVGTITGTVILWDVKNNKQLATLSGQHINGISDLAFIAKGKRLASASFDGRVVIWDVDTSRPITKTQGGHPDRIFDVTYSPDGQMLATASASGGIILRDAVTLQPKRFLNRNSGPVRRIIFTPKGETLISASNDIRFWDTATGNQIGQPITNTYYNSIALNPDGKILAAARCVQIDEKNLNECHQSQIQFWDITVPSNPLQLPEPILGHTDFIMDLAFKPDGKVLASASMDNSIILWDVARRKQIGQPLIGHNFNVFTIAFSPDGTKLASGGRDMKTILWDLAHDPPTWQEFNGGHTNSVTKVVFRPDGQVLASGSMDQSIILRDVATRQRIGRFTGHSDWVDSIAFSPDGKTLASVGKDGVIVLWDVDSESWKKRACDIANRNLSAEEWRQYFGDEPYHRTCPTDP